MVRAIRIFVTGASALREEYVAFARELGHRLMKDTGFVLVTGSLASKAGSTLQTVDKVVAEAAFEALGRSRESAQSRIITILPDNDKPGLSRFEMGAVVRVSYAGIRTRRYSMVLTSDAIIAVSGDKATKEVVELAYIAGKPLLPVPATGGTAREVWDRYEAELIHRLHLDTRQVEALKDAQDFSRAVSACLAAVTHILRPRCFIAMPFSSHPMANTFETMRAVAEELGFQVIRVDQESFVGNIVEAIWDAIRHSDVVIADLTGHRPNIYYEMGISHALAKPTLLTLFSRDGNIPDDVPFDIKAQRIVAYGTTQSLQTQLRELLPNATRTLHSRGVSRRLLCS
jgi:predicted Rossmann-fold nucleotide-binding protein